MGKHQFALYLERKCELQLFACQLQNGSMHFALHVSLYFSQIVILSHCWCIDRPTGSPGKQASLSHGRRSVSKANMTI